MSGPLKWLAMGLLNLVWGTVVLVLGTLFLFPDDALKQRLVWEVERNTPLDAGVDDVGLGLGSVSLTNLVLRPENPAAMGGFQGTILQADRLSVRTSLAKAVQQQVDVAMEGVVFGGELETELALTGGDEIDSEFQLEGLELGRLELEGEGWSADLRGEMSVDADLDFSLSNHEKGAGDLAIEFDGLVVDKIMGMELAAAFNRALLRGELDGDTFTISVGEFLSEQVEAEVGGHITRQPSLMSSRLALTLRFKLNEAFDGLLRMQQGSNARHRSEEGWWHYRVSGQLGRPRFVPDNSAVRRARNAPARQSARDDDDDGPRTRSRPAATRSDSDGAQRQVAGERTAPRQQTTRSAEQRRADLEASRERARERRAERRRLREERNNRRAGRATRRDPVEANQGMDEDEYDEQLDYPRQMAEIPDFDEFVDEGDEGDEDYEDDPDLD